MWSYKKNEIALSDSWFNAPGKHSLTFPAFRCSLQASWGSAIRVSGNVFRVFGIGGFVCMSLFDVAAHEVDIFFVGRSSILKT